MISPETAIHFAVIPASPGAPKKRCKKSANVTRANFVSKCAIFAGRVAKCPTLCYALPVEPEGRPRVVKAPPRPKIPPSPATESSCCKVFLTAVLCA